MANRTYIYGLQNGKHISIGESPSTIPYAFKILAAYNNQVIESDLFDKVVGLKANYEKGKNQLFYFLDFLIETKEMTDQVDFEDAVSKTKEFLNNINAQEILLENGEIYALYCNDGAEMEKENVYAREDYEWIGEDITNLQEYKIKPEQIFHIEDESISKLFSWIIELKENWKTTLGLDCWKSVLYFQFNEEG